MDEGTSSSSSPCVSTPEADKQKDVIEAVCAALATTDLEYNVGGQPVVFARSSYSVPSTASGDADDNRLSLTRGDSVLVLDTSMGKGWWWVEVDGRTGYVPSSYLCSEADLHEIEQRSWQDDEYFDQYATLKIHQEMLSDEPRTLAYQKAIKQCRSCIEGKVVLDVGCGTGILSLMCVRDGGAAKVYAVDASPITEQAQRVVDANGYADRITIIQGKIEDIELPEQVDIILSEWMGTFLLFELMLQSVLFARDLYLKPDGVLWPSEASLYLVPCMADEQVARLDYWQSIYGFDFSMLRETARKEYHRIPLYDHKLNKTDCLAEPQELMTLALKSVAVDDLEYHQQSFDFSVQKHGVLHGFASWFDVHFSGSVGSADESVCLSTGPASPRTHWNQDLCMLDEYVKVWTGDHVTGVLTISRNSEWRRHLHVTIAYAVQREGETVSNASKTFGLWK